MSFDALHQISYYYQLIMFGYCMMIIGSYLVMGIVSAWSVYQYRKSNELVDWDSILASPFVPSISIIAPAYNESATIVDNIRSLISLHYGKLTVIVVNDGSKDDTRERAIEAYDLEKVDFYYNMEIHTQKVRGIYKSKNPAFAKLIFVDKENGGKADAINTGVNVSSTDLFACIDVDCIIEPDAFLKMVKPYLDHSDITTIAVGGIVWLTNDSEIKDGKLLQLRVPEDFVPRMQVIEYFRAFLLGRTAWANINGLLLISGAFGLFDRKIAVAAGGYNHKTVGEDMELVMRMHSYMIEQNEPYQVAYIPEPLCWTEAPGNYNILSRQRNRWTRGTIECLMIHKKMLFNPKYKVLGLLSYPYWLLAEWLAPFMEITGLIFFGIMAIFGLLNWTFVLSLLVLLYLFSITISLLSIYVQETNYHCYIENTDLLKLIQTALLEPFLYHPRVVWWALKGNYDFFTGKNTGWGEMTRQGFNKKKK